MTRVALDRLISSWSPSTCGVWEGKAWRLHSARYAPGDPGGSYRISGRYNRGTDFFGEHAVFSALYLATSPQVSLGEKQRHLTSDNLIQMKDQVLSEFHVRLQAVYDLSEPERLGINTGDLIDDRDLDLPRSLSAALRDLGAEAFLVPSATLLGTNLVVFPDLLTDGSTFELSKSQEARLYAEYLEDG